MITEYEVTGMSCEHCVHSVTTELSRVTGVTGVDVDLRRGLVVVSSIQRLDDADVRAAVDEAGYDLVGTTR